MLPGFAFERLTFLLKVENRLKRGGSLCVNFAGRDILNFQEISGLWQFMFSCLSLFSGLTATPF